MPKFLYQIWIYDEQYEDWSTLFDFIEQGWIIIVTFAYGANNNKIGFILKRPV